MKRIPFISLFTCCLFFILNWPQTAEAQLERERAIPDAPVSDVFWSGLNVGLSTVHNQQAGDLNTSVLHTFGLVEGGVDRFWGLDDGANTRIGLSYGITDRLSAGIGRMTFNNVVDLQSKYNILRQTRDNSVPLELAVKVFTGITTQDGIGLDFSERLTYFASVMIARKFNRLSLQLSPMMAHFNRPLSAADQDQLFGLGILVNVE